MKKQALFVLAGGLLTFAACTNDQAAGGYTQEQVDSTVDARLLELQAQMQASNDSIINVMAQWKADSMIAAAKGQTPSTPKPKAPKAPVVTSETPVTPPPPPPPANPKDERFGGEKVSDKDKKESRFDKDAAQREKEAGSKKKEDRFK